MVKVSASIEAKELKEFVRLSDQDYTDIILEGTMLVMHTGSLEKSAFLYLNTDTNVVNRKVARVTTKVIGELAVDGTLEISFSDKEVKLTFIDNNDLSVSIIEELQICGDIDYMRYLDIDFEEFNQIDKSQYITLSKVASSVGLLINVLDGEATIYAGDDDIAKVGGALLLRKKVEGPNLAMLGYHLKTMLAFTNIYLVGDGKLDKSGRTVNEVVGIKDRLVYSLRQRQLQEVPDMEDILSVLGEPLFTSEVSFNKLAILAKKCNFKGGECVLDLSTGECSYISDLTYSITISMSDFYNTEIKLPDWLLTKVLMYYPEVLNKVVIKLYKRGLYIITEEFDMYLSLRR